MLRDTQEKATARRSGRAHPHSAPSELEIPRGASGSTLRCALDAKPPQQVIPLPPFFCAKRREGATPPDPRDTERVRRSLEAWLTRVSFHITKTVILHAIIANSSEIRPTKKNRNSRNRNTRYHIPAPSAPITLTLTSWFHHKSSCLSKVCCEQRGGNGAVRGDGVAARGYR